jgi:hypothetical protein
MYPERNNIEMNGRKPDAILEESTDEMYLGFCGSKTTLTSQANWSICQVLTVGKLTTIKWVDGLRNFDQVFDNAKTLSYQYLR